MLNNFQHIHQMAEQAKRLLSDDVLTFLNAGSADELAVSRNRAIFTQQKILPRVLKKTEIINSQCQINKTVLDSPLLIAPSAFHGLYSPQGELDTVRAAQKFNSIPIISQFSSIDLCQLTEHCQNVWLQMYLLKDRAINQAILDQAERAGVKQLVLTVDAPCYAKKAKAFARPLPLTNGCDLSHLQRLGVDIDGCLSSPGHFASLLDDNITWHDIEWLAQKTCLPIMLKGVLDPKDTKIAMQYDCINGVIVSNHGGRQLDDSVAPLEVIAQHRDIVGDKLNLLLDGGIQRGSDVFKAIALGADAVLLGRAILWGLVIGGESGVLSSLNILQQELVETMTLCGCANLQSITSDYLYNKTKLENSYA